MQGSLHPALTLCSRLGVAKRRPAIELKSL
jgi:hypothetical protein